MASSNFCLTSAQRSLMPSRVFPAPVVKGEMVRLGKCFNTDVLEWPRSSQCLRVTGLQHELELCHNGVWKLFCPLFFCRMFFFSRTAYLSQILSCFLTLSRGHCHMSLGILVHSSPHSSGFEKLTWAQGVILSDLGNREGWEK